MLIPPNEPTHVIGVCGGAVAGSEAAAMAAERGAIAVVFEQNARPYGKIEDGLPRWHTKLREKEFARIDANLSRPNVLYVPRTRIGEDVSFRELLDGKTLSAMVLANGAWRDRPLPIPGAEELVGKGLVYQNALVYWFNHHEEPGYDGPRLEPADGAVVIGGGLASIDVVKIINLELYRRALRARGIEIGVVELEHAGIAETLAAHGLTREELGVRGCALYYRRRREDMPLASAPDPSPEQLAKLQQARVRIMEKVERKYLVRMEELAVPVRAIVEGGRLVGMVFQRSKIVDGRVQPIDGEEHEVRTEMVVSSIGSIPEPIGGVPMTGELYRFGSQETGELEGMLGVYGLGNVLTGRGNIKDSRTNASRIAAQVLETFLGGATQEERDAAGEDMAAAIHGGVRREAAILVENALDHAPVAPDRIAALYDWIQSRWKAVGYDGDYAGWLRDNAPPAAG